MVEPTNRIRELRSEKGWTSRDLAKALGTTQATISRLEQEKQALTVEWLHKIALALGVRAVDILLADDTFKLAYVRGDLRMQDNPEKPLFDPDMVYPIPVPAFGISLRGVPLDGFQTGDQSWIIATPMRSPDAESIGKQFVLLITDDKGRNQHLSLRTFEKSTFGSVGFVTGEGDPAMRWISAFDPRIRRFWKAVGKYSQL